MEAASRVPARSSLAAQIYATEIDHGEEHELDGDLR